MGHQAIATAGPCRAPRPAPPGRSARRHAGEITLRAGRRCLPSSRERSHGPHHHRRRARRLPRRGPHRLPLVALLARGRRGAPRVLRRRPLPRRLRRRWPAVRRGPRLRHAVHRAGRRGRGGGGERRGRAAHPQPAGPPHPADARPARRHRRAGRAGGRPHRRRVPDLRPLRLRPGGRGGHPAHRRRPWPTGATTPPARSSWSTPSTYAKHVHDAVRPRPPDDPRPHRRCPPSVGATRPARSRATTRRTRPGAPPPGCSGATSAASPRPPPATGSRSRGRTTGPPTSSHPDVRGRLRPRPGARCCATWPRSTGCREVQVGLRPVDDATPARTGRRSRRPPGRPVRHLWARVLDVPAALAARRYATTGVAWWSRSTTRSGSRTAGSGSTAAPTAPSVRASTDRAADLAVPVGALGAAYLGGPAWARLAAGGWVDEHRPGAVARATALFTTDRAASWPGSASTFLTSRRP